MTQTFKVGDRATHATYGEVELAPEHGDGIAFLAMELVDGEPLSAVLRREGRLTSGRTLEIVNFPGQFGWDYLEQGPEVWRVEIDRLEESGCDCCCGSDH